MWEKGTSILTCHHCRVKMHLIYSRVLLDTTAGIGHCLLGIFKRTQTASMYRQVWKTRADNQSWFYYQNPSITLNHCFAPLSVGDPHPAGCPQHLQITTQLEKKPTWILLSSTESNWGFLVSVAWGSLTSQGQQQAWIHAGNYRKEELHVSMCTVVSSESLVSRIQDNLVTRLTQLLLVSKFQFYLPSLYK